MRLRRVRPCCWIPAFAGMTDRDLWQTGNDARCRACVEAARSRCRNDNPSPPARPVAQSLPQSLPKRVLARRPASNDNQSQKRPRNPGIAASQGKLVNTFENSLLWKLLNRSLWELIGLGLAILVMVWLIMQIRSWLTGDDDPADGDHELLMSIRDLKREGDLTDDEYRSIKSRLVNRLGDPLDTSDSLAPRHNPQDR